MEMVYEHFFYLKMHGKWSFLEAYNLPIGLRNWFVKRLSKKKTKNYEKHKTKEEAKYEKIGLTLNFLFLYD
jgi:hypothetical protein